MKKILIKAKKILYELIVIKKYERNIKKRLPQTMDICLPLCEKYNMHLAFGMVLRWHRDKTLYHNDIDFIALPGFEFKGFLDEIKDKKDIKLKAISWAGTKPTAITLDILGCPVGISIASSKNSTIDTIISLYPKPGANNITKEKVGQVTVLKGYSACEYSYKKLEVGEKVIFKGISFIPPKNIVRHLEETYSTTWVTPIKSNEETAFKVGPKQAKINILETDTKVEIFRR